MATKRRESAIPENVPSGPAEPVVVSAEFIATLRQAGVSHSTVAAVEKASRVVPPSMGVEMDLGESNGR